MNMKLKFVEKPSELPFENLHFLYAQGAFTTQRWEKGRCFFEKHHRERVLKTWEIFWSYQDSGERLNELFEVIQKKVGFETYVLRVNLIPSKDLKTCYVVFQKRENLSKMTAQKVHLNFESEIFYTSELKKIKTIDYKERLIRLKEKGFDGSLKDLLFCDEREWVKECTFSNIIYRRGNRYFTPENKGDFLEGCALKGLCEIFEKHLRPIEKVPTMKRNIMESDELWRVNSAKIFDRVFSIEDKIFNESSFHEELCQTLEKYL